ncbi:DUF6264 family protein [Curtobacterium sp. MCPF17_002]|uniref:DUF6264 family protein n=1 Tax=Curtobacterium sp. MCPF17_002 TaxID=2175645 RepID=UPI000DA964EE|nr:DUF6264 family protein [Curtobacterium sp. MCPF17_002]WIB78348.1 DUF6264 family protein [Curtobacterium sp. MCPF17_002]
MSGERTDAPDGWSSVPAREPGHVPDQTDGREARHTPATSADGPASGRVQGRPAPRYGEYAPEGWVNPVLVEQERLEQEERSRSLRQQAAQDAVRDRRNGPGSGAAAGRGTGGAGAGPDGPTAGSGASTDRRAPAAGRFGASPLDFVLTVGFLAVGLWTVLESLSVGTTASTIRTVVEQQYTDLSNPAALSSAVLVRAVVLVVVFVLVAWWSLRRLRSRRWTFWVPLVGGIAATVLGMVPVMVVLFQDPHFAAYLQRMAGG